MEDSCLDLEDKRQDDSEGTVCEQSAEDQTIVQGSVALPRDAEKHDAAGPREDSPVVESPKFTGFDHDSLPTIRQNIQWRIKDRPHTDVIALVQR